ncbi:penicillin-binding protein 2 [Patescibacteria group bacterium]|nr:penicillin-binding protein 2 [Patescibacteria group bacterium]
MRQKRRPYTYRKTQEKNQNSSGVSSRINTLIIAVIVVLVIVLGRLFDVQILRGNYYSALASGQHQIFEDLFPSRGTIYIEDKFSKDLYPLAVNKKMYLIYAVPRSVEDPHGTSEKLHDVLDMPTEEIYARLSKEDDVYEPIKRRVPEDVKDEVMEEHIRGISYQPEHVRYYTENEFASHILGFLGYEGDKQTGKYGLEGYYDTKLAGEKGFLAADKDALGRFVIGGRKLFTEATDGSHLVLTIDRVIQYKVEKILKESVEQFGAESGSVVIMDPTNGEIIALANSPDFNPNEYSKVDDVGVFTNTAIYELYEPGSAFKPLVVAAAINSGLISPNTVIEDSGSVKIDKYTIKNSDLAANGNITITEVLERSSNIGMVQVGNMLGRDRLYNYLERFGFTDLTGIDLNSEAMTNISEPRTWSEVDLATVSFGQGVAVTPLRLVNAMASIANGGKLVKPHIVKKYIHSDESEELVPTDFHREAVSKSTADTVAAMMVSVVEHGNANTAKIPGYKIAGKTGTAQVAKEGARGYDPNKKITSFVGFGPVHDPKFVVLVKFNNPGGDVWGASTAAPTFKKIAEELIKYYQIPPTEKVDK